MVFVFAFGHSKSHLLLLFIIFPSSKIVFSSNSVIFLRRLCTLLQRAKGYYGRWQRIKVSSQKRSLHHRLFKSFLPIIIFSKVCSPSSSFHYFTPPRYFQSYLAIESYLAIKSSCQHLRRSVCLVASFVATPSTNCTSGSSLTSLFTSLSFLLFDRAAQTNLVVAQKGYC